jgi:CubicO group peptidase (beta-lactamase class C family)
VRAILGLLLAAGVIVGAYFAVTLIRPDKPAVPNDWARATPAAAGFAPDQFDRTMESLPKQHKGIFALLVARHGKLVFEHYYQGYQWRGGFEMYSITKSVTSALVGIAIHDKRFKNIDQRIAEFFPSWTPPRARHITIRELLTMTSGWPGENDPRSDTGESPANLVRAILQRPVVHRVGVFDYDSASTHVLSAALTHVTGESEERYARTHLFGPLNIKVKDFWPKDEHGNTFGGNGLTLLATDALKLGQLYLQHGSWHGRQLVPRAWVSQSTTQHVAVRGPVGYGYGWWTRKKRGANAFVGIGYGAQILGVIPKLDLVVAVFSDPAYPEIPVEELLDKVAATVRQ